jgi:methyltransferase family protein
MAEGSPAVPEWGEGAGGRLGAMRTGAIPELVLRWHVFRCRRRSDTKTRFLLELARAVARAPRGADAPPFLEIGTRSGGSALLMLRVLHSVYGDAPAPFVLTVDPYGARPYEGASFVYDAPHYRAMKRALARYANHVHYMMDSELFLRELGALYLWVGGEKRRIERFTVVYLDGSHDPDIVWREIETLRPRVVPGGFLIVDDTDWFDGAVRRRLDAAAPGWGVTLRHNGRQSLLAIPH